MCPSQPPPSGESRPAAVSSPCVSLCGLDPTRSFCTGCVRTRAEIGGWRAMSEPERRAIMAALPERRARLGLPAAPAASG